MKLRQLSRKHLTIIGGAATVSIALLFCLFNGRCTLLTPDQLGHRLFVHEQYSEAARHFTDPMWKGVALFNEGSFEEAAGVFAGYDTPTAAFNHGNSLVMLGQYQEAVARYDRALELRPGWQDAETNRDIASGRAEMLKKEGGDMSGGKMGADEIVFNKTKPSPDEGTEETEGGQQLSDEALRQVWLRKVQTKPADFLRAKFAYQYQTPKDGAQKSATGEENQ